MHALRTLVFVAALASASACHLFSSDVACVDDAVCNAGEACVNGFCAAATGEGEGEAGEGEGDAGEGEGDAGEGEGDAGEGEGDAGEGEGEGEGEGDGPCPVLDGADGTRASTGSCIYFLRSTEDLTLAQAQATCASEGAQLVVPLSGDEQQVVASIVPDGVRVWVGMQDFAGVGGVGTSRFLPASFEVAPGNIGAFFADGEPEDQPVGVTELCVDAGSDGLWTDMDCGLRRTGAVCEVAKCGNGVRDGFLEECDGDVGCDASCHATDCPHPADTTVVLVEGRCFVRLNDTFSVGLTASAALGACTSRVSSTVKLVLPTSLAQNKALRGLARKLAWVDDSDVVTDGVFVTSAGTAPSPTFFGTNDPVNTVNVADCIVARTTGTGQWRAVTCASKRGVVCAEP